MVICEEPTQDPEKRDPSPQVSKSGAILRFVLFLAAIALVLLILVQTGYIHVFFNKEEAREFLQSLGPIKFLGFIVLQAAQVVLAPVPGEVTGIIGGYFFGIFWGIILSTLGLTIGSFAAFMLARIFGRPLVEKVVDRKVLDRFNFLLDRKGASLVFILFLIPGVPKDYLCFILGLGHLSSLEFLALSSVGRVFGTILLTLSGGYLRYQEYGKLAVVVGVAVALSVTAFLLRKKIDQFFKSFNLKKS
ncbi:MAG: TVP38/TMEM64 family protein [Desulfobacteraceae bacterium]|nr:TVP38/TMEM64 family protein [Desulfobacteraceae bacterium]